MATDLETLASFIPDTLLRRVVAEDAPPDQAQARPAQVAALYADLSGFSKLTTVLSKQGRRGSEQVSEIVNRCFHRLIEAVLAHDGDLVTVSGDAVLAIWPLEAGHTRTLRDAAQQASACALAAYIGANMTMDQVARRVEVDQDGYLWWSEEWLQLFGAQNFVDRGKGRILLSGSSEGREAFLFDEFEAELHGFEVYNNAYSTHTFTTFLLVLRYIETVYGPSAMPQKIVLGVTPLFVRTKGVTKFLCSGWLESVILALFSDRCHPYTT